MLGSIYPIVEGHGEVEATPILLRRFAHEVFHNDTIHIFSPFRLAASQMLSGANLEKAVEFAGRKIRQLDKPGAILVLADADDNCPATTGPRLLSRVKAARSDIPASVVLPKFEYEAWFLAAAASLRGKAGVKNTAAPHPAPESVRGAKEFIELNFFDAGRKYSPTVDQPALTAHFSFDEAEACRSFQKLKDDLSVLFAPT